MCAYLFGLKQDPLVASAMAFATICLARLLHGFNCRSNLPLTKIGFYTNRSSIYAFLIGFFFTACHFIRAIYAQFIYDSNNLDNSIICYLCICIDSYYNYSD